MKSNYLTIKLQELFWACVAVVLGAVVVYVCGRLLDVSMELFYGIHTFNFRWILNLFLVPFIAGIFVSFVYGLGGKIISYLAPLPVMFYNYYAVQSAVLPDGVSVLPIYYWFLIVIVASEFAGLGGIVGEILIKKTYGRRPKHLIHKRYGQTLKERLSDRKVSSST